MSGKPRGRVGKPKQDPDWRAESAEGHLLPQSRVAAAVCGHGPKDSAVYKLLQQNRKRKRLWNKNCFDCLCFSAHSGLVHAEFRSVPGNSNSLSLPVSLLFLSCALCMWRLKCRTHYACCCFLCTGGEASQWGPAWRRGTGRGSTGASWKCTAQAQRLRKIKKKKKKKPCPVSQVSLPASFSEVRRGARKATQIHHQLQKGNSTVFTW